MGFVPKRLPLDGRDLAAVDLEGGVRQESAPAGRRRGPCRRRTSESSQPSLSTVEPELAAQDGQQGPARPRLTSPSRSSRSPGASTGIARSARPEQARASGVKNDAPRARAIAPVTARRTTRAPSRDGISRDARTSELGVAASAASRPASRGAESSARARRGESIQPPRHAGPSGRGRLMTIQASRTTPSARRTTASHRPPRRPSADELPGTETSGGLPAPSSFGKLQDGDDQLVRTDHGPAGTAEQVGEHGQDGFPRSSRPPRQPGNGAAARSSRRPATRQVAAERPDVPRGRRANRSRRHRR